VSFFGLNSGQAFAAVIGLVNVAFWLQKRLFKVQV